MDNLVSSLQQLGELVGGLRRASTYAFEDHRLLELSGNTVDARLYTMLLQIQHQCDFHSSPSGIEVDDERSVLGYDLEESDAIGKTWKLRIGKLGLVGIPVSSENYDISLLFFFSDLFSAWSTNIDPLSATAPLDSRRSVIIFVRGLTHSYGSAMLSVAPWFVTEFPERITDSKFPSMDEVHEVIHVVGERPAQVSPAFYGLTWGQIAHPKAMGFLKASIITLAACLTQELKCSGNEYYAVLRGLRKISPVFFDSDDLPSEELNALLARVVTWVFAERRETRHKLIIDRITLEWTANQSFIKCLNIFLAQSWEQAKDSYGFVILERKDAHQKELRELMKDVRSQADLYAAKIRELLGGLSRDVIAILLLIGLSLLAKVDPADAETILKRPAVAIFFKVLAAYFLFSCILQIIVSMRDAALAYSESKSWLTVLRAYTSTSELSDRYTKPVEKRRTTFYWAIGIFFLIYITISATLWFLPTLISGVVSAKP